jgi:hypothetical protein
MDDPHDLIFAMFALAITAVPACGGRVLSGEGARPARDLHVAGLGSDIIDPVND